MSVVGDRSVGGGPNRSPGAVTTGDLPSAPGAKGGAGAFGTPVASVPPAVAPGGATRAPVRTVRAVLLGCLELTKPRIVLLVLFTGVPALLMATPGFPAASIFWGTLAGIALSAASAASFNHFFDRDIDARMRRTAQRPLPSGLLPPIAALGIGFALATAAWLTLVAFANVLAAAIGMISIAYYALFYTVWLKRRTPQNIVIGGGAGASAPLIAWAAATGSVGLPAMLLAGIVFLWTPPHFWALALYRRDDYARAGIPMLPVTHGESETRRQIVLYSIALVAVTVTLWPLGVSGWLYGVSALALGGGFLALAWRLARHPGTPNAVSLFRYSIVYLFALYLMMGADALLARLL